MQKHSLGQAKDETRAQDQIRQAAKRGAQAPERAEVMKEHILYNTATKEDEGNEFMFAAEAELRNEILAGEGSACRWIATEKL